MLLDSKLDPYREVRRKPDRSLALDVERSTVVSGRRVVEPRPACHCAPMLRGPARAAGYASFMNIFWTSLMP